MHFKLLLLILFYILATHPSQLQCEYKYKEVLHDYVAPHNHVRVEVLGTHSTIMPKSRLERDRDKGEPEEIKRRRLDYIREQFK